MVSRATVTPALLFITTRCSPRLTRPPASTIASSAPWPSDPLSPTTSSLSVSGMALGSGNEAPSQTARSPSSTSALSDCHSSPAGAADAEMARLCASAGHFLGSAISSECTVTVTSGAPPESRRGVARGGDCGAGASSSSDSSFRAETGDFGLDAFFSGLLRGLFWASSYDEPHDRYWGTCILAPLPSRGDGESAAWKIRTPTSKS
mmetsp:Transcript_29159/g.98319  ORF Transcript_29159/g.98319 Transcript_29159/m.98319 type:complete len:206 (+) Transcript_29159:188-805(+)